MGTRRAFSREFKLEAVKLVKERGVSVAQAARELSLKAEEEMRSLAMAKRCDGCGAPALFGDKDAAARAEAALAHFGTQSPKTLWGRTTQANLP